MQMAARTPRVSHAIGYISTRSMQESHPYLDTRGSSIVECLDLQHILCSHPAHQASGSSISAVQGRVGGSALAVPVSVSAVVVATTIVPS